MTHFNFRNDHDPESEAASDGQRWATPRIPENDADYFPANETERQELEWIRDFPKRSAGHPAFTIICVAAAVVGLLYPLQVIAVGMVAVVFYLDRVARQTGLVVRPLLGWVAQMAMHMHRLLYLVRAKGR